MNTNYVGIDYHTKFAVATRMNKDGDILSTDKIDNTKEDIRGYLSTNVYLRWQNTAWINYKTRVKELTLYSAASNYPPGTTGQPVWQNVYQN